MIKIWLLILGLDVVALQFLFQPPSELLYLVSALWMIYFHFLVGWMGGSMALKKMGTHNVLGALQGLAVVFLIALVILRLFLQYHLEESVALVILLTLQVTRLAPLVSFSIVASPILWLFGPNKPRALRQLLVLQVCAWLGASLLFRGTNPPVPTEHFLFYSLLLQDYGHGLLVAGLLLARPLLPGPQVVQVAA